MSNRLFFQILLGFLLFFASCNRVERKKDVETPIPLNKEVTVYYFHYSVHCATCDAVESTARNVCREMDTTRVAFVSLNLEENGIEDMARKIGVYGQSLVIVSREKKYDLTGDGFLYALHNPEKLRSLMKGIIEPILLK